MTVRCKSFLSVCVLACTAIFFSVYAQDYDVRYDGSELRSFPSGGEAGEGDADGSNGGSGADLEGIGAQEEQAALSAAEEVAGLAADVAGAVEVAANAVNEESVTADSAEEGDPVRISDGSFIYRARDNILTRNWKDTNPQSRMIGDGWFLNIESRIIRGITSGTGQAVSRYQACLNRVRPHENTLREIANTSHTIRARYERVQALVATLEGELSRLVKAGQDAAVLEAFNARSGTASFPPAWTKTGNGNLTLLDEEGTPFFCVPASEGVWKPALDQFRHEWTVTSTNGKNAMYASGFRAVHRTGRELRYDENGCLREIRREPVSARRILEKDVNVRESVYWDTILLARNENGNVTDAVRDDGSRLVFTYVNGKLLELTGEAGTVRYGYRQGRLVSVTSEDGQETTYEYGSHRLSSVTASNGAKTAIIRNTPPEGKRKVVSTVSPRGNAEYFNWNEGRRELEYTSTIGERRVHRFDEQGRPLFRLDADGRETLWTYEGPWRECSSMSIDGSTWQYAYDSQRNLIQVAHPDRSLETWTYSGQTLTSYTDRDNITYAFSHDDRGNCTRITRAGITLYRASYYPGTSLLQSEQRGERPAVRWERDERGRINRRITAEGETYWTHDENGRINYISYADGKTLRISYTKNSLTETCSNGLEKTIAFDSARNPVSIRERDRITGETRTKTIVYDTERNPVELSDSLGIIARWVWDPAGRLTEEHLGEWSTHLAYTAGGFVRSIRKEKASSPAGHTVSVTQLIETTRYHEGIYSKRGSISTLFTSEGDLLNLRTGDDETIVERTPEGRFAALRGPDGSLQSVAVSLDLLCEDYFVDGQRERRVHRNSDGTIASVSSHDGSTTQYRHDSEGRITGARRDKTEYRFIRDGEGLVTAAHTLENGSLIAEERREFLESGRTEIRHSGEVSRTIRHNAWGEVISVTDGEGNTTTHERDERGRNIRITDAEGNSTQIAWNAIGLPERIEHPDGNVLTYTWNVWGKLERTVDAAGTVYEAVYDAESRLIRERSRPGKEIHYDYDGQGRVRIIGSAGEIDETRSWSNGGRTLERTSAGGILNRFRYDHRGNLVEETNRSGKTKTYERNEQGTLVGMRSFKGDRVTIQAPHMNAAGFPVAISDDFGRTEWSWSTGGQLVEQSDSATGEKTVFRHDKAGRLVEVLSPRRHLRYTRGRRGEIIRIEDSTTGMTVSLTYDSMLREISRKYGNGTSEQRQYDRAGRIIAVRQLDRRGTLVHGEAYVYDEQGRRTHTVDHQGFVTIFQYDHRSRINMIVHPWTEERSRSDRSEAEEQGIPLPPQSGRPETRYVPAAELALLRELSRTVLGSRALIAPLHTVWRESFTYTPDGQMASRSTPWGTIPYAYGSEGLLVSAGKTTFGYDGEGNLAEIKSLWKNTRYIYTDANRIAEVVVTDLRDGNTFRAQYEYDTLGRRVSACDSTGSETYTVYAGTGFDVLYERTTQAEPSRPTASDSRDSKSAPGDFSGIRYRHPDTAAESATPTQAMHRTASGFSGYRYPLANGGVLYGLGEAGKVSYFGGDAHGSVRSESDEAGAVRNVFTYDVYGKPLGEGTQPVYGYAGKPYGRQSGLYDFGYRDYAPQLAMFTSEDPVRDGSNWYAYCAFDPVNFLDWLGLMGVTVDFGIKSLTLAQFDRDARSLTVTHYEKTPEGSIVVSNLATMTVTAHSDVRNEINGLRSSPDIKTMPANAETPQYYYPRGFPDGTYAVGKSYTPSNTREMGTIAIPTNATQTVPTYGTTTPGRNNGGTYTATGTQVDAGYLIHLAGDYTLGCIGMNSQSNVNDYAALSDKAINSGGTSIIIAR